MKALICGICESVVTEDNLSVHLASVHGWFSNPVLPSIRSSVSAKKLAKQEPTSGRKYNKTVMDPKNQRQIQMLATNGTSVCPWCAAAVSQKNLKRHMNSRCPKREGHIKLHAEEVKSSKQIPSTYNDPLISAYLSKNPEPPRTGPQGVPQDRYRRSAYGRAGMEYDSWSRE